MTLTLDTERVLCAVDDLAETPCRGFRVGDGPWPLSGFVVRKGNTIRAYLNRCPHAGHPLDLKPDQFLAPDHSLIVCSSHGALFEIDTGYCVDGPCAGESLVSIPVELVSGHVLLADGVNPGDYE
jgi:nitrite reductase/ring-hydroxylating ferredoxin subunit